MNVDEPPNPILNNLYLTDELTGPVMIDLTTIDSNDPMDNYTRLVVYNIATTTTAVHVIANCTYMIGSSKALHVHLAQVQSCRNLHIS